MPFKPVPVLLTAALLGGCTSTQRLMDHATASVGLGDDAPKSYTSSSSSQPSRA
jgi:hypothetical protein